MPGARHLNFRFGDRTELLAEFCLNTIAFTTRVPRQEDIGYDFFCVLSEVKKRLVWSGPFFTVQVKSDPGPLIFQKRYEIDWVKNLENPFFLVVGDRDQLRIDIYSTWMRLNGFLWRAAERIVLQPGPPKEGYEQVWTANAGEEQIISLGKPVISATVHEFMDKSRAEILSNVLKQWIILDRENIVNSQAGMHWVIGPQTYETNNPIPKESRPSASFYWNAKNLKRCQFNFLRAATALRLTLRNVLGPDRKRDLRFVDKIKALDMVLRVFKDDLEPTSLTALRKYIDINM